MERLAQRADRWRRRPRFRAPRAVAALTVLLLALLLTLRLRAPSPPPVLPPPSSPPPAERVLTLPSPAPEPVPEPTDAEKVTQIAIPHGCPEGCAVPPPGCDVKGNISQKTGERIYHLPGQRYYDRTVISPGQGEAWFCTEAEARANGWRKSKV